MDNPQDQTNSEITPDTASKSVCPQCHQPILPEYYFCPNCGKKLEEAPLSTTVWAQLWLYIFTLIIMPLTGYLAYRHWKGIQYFKSQDPKAKRIGITSIILLIGTVVAIGWSIWAGIAQLKEALNAQQNNINSLGGLY